MSLTSRPDIAPARAAALLALVLGAASLACGGPTSMTSAPAARTAVPPLPEATQDAAARILEQYRQAYEVRSIDALAPIHAQTPELTIVRQGQILVGWDAVRPHLEELLDRATEVRIEIRDSRVAPLGPGGLVITAWVSRTVADAVTSVRENGVLTLVLRREGERWLIVSEHFSFSAAAS